MDGPDGLGRWLPGLALLRRHRGAALRRDLVAGVVLAALLVPQGMAYAELAGVPPVAGLYATLVPLVLHFLLGPSRILVLGPDSAVSPLVAAAIIPLAAAGDASARIALASVLAIVVGAIMFTGGLARFGFVTELLSIRSAWAISWVSRWHPRRSRRSPILPHHRRGRLHLPRRDGDRLARLGGPPAWRPSAPRPPTRGAARSSDPSLS